MNSSVRSYRTIFWAAAFIGLTLDLSTKYAAFGMLDPGEEQPLISEMFSILHQPSLNHGALFGIGNEHKEWANGTFAVISGIAVFIIICMALQKATSRDLVMCLALGLVLSGAMGNFYDRVVFGGVRDFLWFRTSWINWPVFNIADSCLVCGAGLLILRTLFPGVNRPRSEQSITNDSTRVQAEGQV